MSVTAGPVREAGAAGTAGGIVRRLLGVLAKRVRSRLFRKYAALLVALVGSALVVSTLVEVYYSFRENRAAQVLIQREKAAGAAAVIGQFVREIEGQLGWTTHASVLSGTDALDQRRLDFLRLLRQAPAITEVAYIDPQGREQIRVSRLAMDVLGSGVDRSKDVAFQQAKASRRYVSEVYFRKESEPYLSLAIAGASRSSGVTIAEVNLKFIWDVVSRIRTGKAGTAYAVDGRGFLIAHPDIGLVLRKTDFSSLPQVKAALADERPVGVEPDARDRGGREVLAAHATVDALKWHVFVEQPLAEALEPVYASLWRSGVIGLAGLGLSAIAGLWLAQRMVVPVQTLADGATRIGDGDLGHRITIGTGLGSDQFQQLADSFNDMGARLKESYASLERKVKERTAELKEALEYQTATAKVLGVISKSPNDLQPVLDAIVETALELCEAEYSLIAKRGDDGRYHLAASCKADAAFIDWVKSHPLTAGDGSAIGIVAQEKRTLHLPDALADPRFTDHARQRRSRARTMLAVPLMRDGGVLGVIFLARTEVLPFSDRQVDLVTTFADQAVIAIENARLFEAEQTRTRELQESLEQQTATADILRVISTSSNDTTPVFKAIVDAGRRLVPGSECSIALLDGDTIRLAAFTEADRELAAIWKSRFPVPLSREYFHGAAIIDCTVIDVPDIDLVDSRFTAGKTNHLPSRYRAITHVPLVSGGKAVGALAVPRMHPGALSEKQLALLMSFADQAVIAIENARLFEAEQTRTKELQEALKRQTATSDVLNVISRSPTDATPVFDIIGESAERLCDAEISVVSVLDGDVIRVAGIRGISAKGVEMFRRHFPMPLARETITARTIRSGEIIHVGDVLADATYDNKDLALATGYRSCLAVPMFRQGQVVGSIFVARTEPSLFSESQVQLLRTFADQAVIAIENARLFEEVETRTAELQESLEYQTATAEVLGVISRSPAALQPVLDAITATAARLCDAEYSFIVRVVDGRGELAAANNVTDDFVRYVTENPIALDRDTITGRVAVTGATVHVADVLEDPEFKRLDWQTVGKQRTVLGVPLMREGTLMGVMLLARTRTAPFSEKQIALIETFADQAVIAINNVGLFEEVQARTRELQETLEYQTATAEVLGVISRSPNELQPVFDAIAASAAELCGAAFSNIQLYDGRMLALSIRDEGAFWATT